MPRMLQAVMSSRAGQGQGDVRQAALYPYRRLQYGPEDRDLQYHSRFRCLP